MSSLSSLHWGSSFYVVSALVLGISLARWARNWGRNPNGLPLPPGPKGYPIIGSLYDMPSEKEWLVYHDWCKKYGGMVYFEVLGQPYLILDTLEQTTDLFDKRSTKYSDRMDFPMLIDLCGWGFNLGLMRYGQQWRRHRKVFHEHFNLRAIERYSPIQTREVRAFLRRLSVSPQEFMHHIRHTFAATIMDISYGIRVEDTNDPYINRAELALASFAEAGIPGSFLVDILPWMKHIPSWMPGATFKKKAAHWKSITEQLLKIPFGLVKEQVAKGAAPPSVSATLISNLPPSGDPERAEEEKIAENVAAISYAAGADTTVSSVQSFFLAMITHPEVLLKAQEEIDSVVGRSRLPEITDKDSLPYITAVVTEVMRWHSVFPLGVAHSLLEDDDYNGYFIPKGTIVMGNSWSILHDSDAFEDPLSFNPERYLKNGQFNHDLRNPTCAFFGYGRRICPGRHLNQSSFFLTISSVIATYNIRLPLDENGKPVEFSPDVTSGFISYPVAFPCQISPRDSQAERLIHETELDYA